jgi:FHA domain/FhaA, N-terminal domain
VPPVELGSRLVREADLNLFDTMGGPGAPNVFEVVLGGEPDDPEVLEMVSRELARYVEDAAADRGWRLEGPARVDVGYGPGDRASEVEITTAVEPGRRLAWAHLEPVAGGATVDVTINRSVVGRSGTCDVHVAGDDVSRHHAVLWQEAGSIWVADIGSSNGTTVNGEAVAGAVPLVDGDRLAFGETAFVFRPEG